jgi:hypothetical protein
LRDFTTIFDEKEIWEKIKNKFLNLLKLTPQKGIKPDKKTDQGGKVLEDYWPASKRVSCLILLISN